MARHAREAKRAVLMEAADFNRQMVEALRAAPWWMISIAFHVFVVVLSTLFTSEPVPLAAAPTTITEFGAASLPPETPKDPDPTLVEPVESITPNDLVATEPVFKTEGEISDRNTDDVDMPSDSTSAGDGNGDSVFEGPMRNTLIGLCGGAGSHRGDGIGSNRNRRTIGRSGRPDRPADLAVEEALRWLAAHQSADGGWETAGFGRWCDGRPASGEGPDGAGKAVYDVGVTGLSLLAFLGAGYTSRSEGAFGKVVAGGLRYLRNAQDAEGCFGARATGHYVYNHAIATLAMVEAFGMTGSVILRSPAQKGLDFLALARNPYAAWRYGVKPGDNDTSVTGWMMMALKSAKLVDAGETKAGRAAPLVYDEDAFEGIRSWIDKMTDPDTGRVGYQQRGSGPARTTELQDRFPASKSESMTAVGVLARIFLGENPKTSDAIRKGADLCANLAPVWNRDDGSIDVYYWYYATLAMFQVGGEPWKRWEAAMKPAIVDTQRKDGEYCLYRGSWDPIDAWGGDGGRVYSTACLAMCLEVWYRYDRVTGTR